MRGDRVFGLIVCVCNAVLLKWFVAGLQRVVVVVVCHLKWMTGWMDGLA